MNLNILKRNNAQIDDDVINKIATKNKLNKTLVELLYSRGFTTETDILNFLHPSLENFYDPFLMKGMKQAVERLNRAIENEEKVVIYGDYDADGICACAILSLYLSSRGLNVYTHIPNRVGDGYGLSIESVEKIIDSAIPDLILTCDCGISGAEEVAHAIDLGVDVIITDHHEVSSLVPECIVVNPKQIDCKYPYNYLCGAGVALKLVEAMGGMEAAKEYFDIASIATIADLVPLLDENRLIVQLGLKQLEERKNLGLKLLFKQQGLGQIISSSDIAYKIAPRINAAGRMGDAYRAFELLTTTDLVRASILVAEINEDNAKRKSVCDELYNEAIIDLQYEDLSRERAIILSHPSWEKGITGIVAARLAGDFRRPSFVLVSSGDAYKGTSRSIPNINIYDLLTSVSDLLVEFGGHSQAAGFSIKKERIPEFKVRVNKYLEQFPEKLFEPNLEYDLCINCEDINLDIVKALESIEPIGNGNSKPFFKTTVKELNVATFKNNTNHTLITINGLQIWAFNYNKQNQFLCGNSEKNLVLELQMNCFNGKESPKAVLKGVDISELYINDEVARANFIKNILLKGGDRPPIFKTYDKEELDLILGTDIYGTLVIAASKTSYMNFKNYLPKFVLSEFLYSSSKNNYSRIIISPEFDENLLLYGYNKIIFLDSPLNDNIIQYLNKKTKAEIFIPKEFNGNCILSGIDMQREIFGKYYDVFRKNSELKSSSIFSYYKTLSTKVEGLNMSQFVVCLSVFLDLEFVNIDRGSFGISINKDVKKELTSSKIYQQLLKIIKGKE